MAKKRTSSLHDYDLKIEDAKKRLGNNFICFTRFQGKNIIIRGGDFYLIQKIVHENVDVYILGASSAELHQAFRIVQAIFSEISDLFSRRDIHSMLILDLLSEYLKTYAENKNKVRALAVEFLMHDIEGRYIAIDFDGNTRIVYEEEQESNPVVIGGYARGFRTKITAKVKEFIKYVEDDNKGAAERVKLKIKDVLGVKECDMDFLT